MSWFFRPFISQKVLSIHFDGILKQTTPEGVSTRLQI